MKVTQPNISLGLRRNVLSDSTNKRRISEITRKRKNEESHESNKVARKDKIYVDPVESPKKKKISLDEEIKENLEPDKVDHKNNKNDKLIESSKSLTSINGSLNSPNEVIKKYIYKNTNANLPYVDVAVQTDSIKVSNDIENTILMMTDISPPSEYYKLLAERRLVALEETLIEKEILKEENTSLMEENTSLKEEIVLLEEMVDEAKQLAELVRLATTTDDDDLIAED